MFNGENVRIILFAILLISFSAYSNDYKEGQKWSYKNRFLEGSSTLTILKIEEYQDLGTVIHIRLDDISMVNPVKGNEINEIPHLPFKKVGIDNSVTKLIGNVENLPEFKEGYDIWKEAYDSGQAGAFETNVKDTLGALLGAEWVEKE
jgi:hypothetical protein